MISDKMSQAISDQLTKEFYSGYLYMAMAAYFESETLPGFAHWMRMQAQEESCHGLIMFNYIAEQGGRPKLGAIEAPDSKFKSPLDVFEKGLKHEKFVTASINKLMDLSIKEKDYATGNMLKWFVDEQVEEEGSFDKIRAQLARIGDGNGIFMLDKELFARVFNLPSPLAAAE